MRGKNLLSICLLAVLVVSMVPMHFAIASPDPEIFVWTPISVTNPGMTMTIEIRIKDAVDVHGWEVKLYWDLSLTEYPPAVTEGGFLKSEGETAGVWIREDPVAGYIMLTNNLVEDVTASGDGKLVSLDFEVVETGESDIEIRDSLLWDGDLNSIDHTATDGFFYTTKPVVSFTWTPSNPWIEETTTFNATYDPATGKGSYDPDNWIDPTPGALVDFTWDFGDGTIVSSGASPTVTHEYAGQRFEAYAVTLTVTDDDGAVWSKTQPLRIWRDVVLVDLWFDETWYLDRDDSELGNGQNVLLIITATNMGTQTEAFDVYLTVVHDETGYEPEIELWWANPFDLPPGAGSGFGLLGAWFNFGWKDEIGDYTATLSMSVHDPEGEGDTTNNGPIVREFRVTEANLIMARPDTRHFKISERGDELHLYGKAKNTEKVTTPPAGLYTWIAYDVVDPFGDEFRVETGAELIYNEEESGELMTSLEVVPGIYSFTAYACYSYMSQGEVYFYEDPATEACWPDGCRGFSRKIKTFTVVVVP